MTPGMRMGQALAGLVRQIQRDRDRDAAYELLGPVSDAREALLVLVRGEEDGE